ncbi:MAG: hypothetical protein A2133_03180 [Actinobacteria bacterium RBG_16_64_13]|nr:MAG: hypothetical protein A2133_03180 [Actinobacteria bacterium RBG_16_64_13]
MATDAMVAQLEGDDERIPELAAQINNTAPKVPTWIRDELETMLDDLDVGNEELAELDVPAGFEDSDYWLGEAITHMANRVYATIQGIEAMWDTGKVSSSTPFFNEGRTERDEYRKALQKYHDFLPID